MFKHHAPSVTPNSRQSLMNLFSQTSLGLKNINTALYGGSKSVVVSSSGLAERGAIGEAEQNDFYGLRGSQKHGALV